MTIEKQHYNLSLYYPFNSMRTCDAVEKLLDNLHAVAIEDLEKLTEDIK